MKLQRHMTSALSTCLRAKAAPHRTQAATFSQVPKATSTSGSSFHCTLCHWPIPSFHIPTLRAGLTACATAASIISGNASRRVAMAASGGSGGQGESERLASRPDSEKLRITEEVLPVGAHAAVFDMDGTLLHSNPKRVESWSEACRRKGLVIDREKYLKETGKSGRDIVDLLCQEQGVDLSEEDRKAVVEDESALFKDQGLPDSGLVPVVVDLVEAARARGLKVAVCSGGQADVVQQALAERGLGDCFDAVVTSKDVPHAKPDPDIFLLAAERLGVDPSRCVAYEDAEQGFKSATQAGYMCVVDVTRLPGHPEREERHG